jgi:uncharacterized protein (DUF924 family)
MYQEIIKFWFEDIEPSQWWVKSDDFDLLIRERFASVHAQAVRGELFAWRETAEGRLAEILVLDQFSRNMFRDTAQAFAYDPLALVLAQEAVSVAANETLSPVQCSFLYMPFMHSESLLIHHEAVALYQKNGIQDNLDFELKHKKIIEMFGRYPHRNSILGRQPTEQEVEFLTTPGSAF